MSELGIRSLTIQESTHISASPEAVWELFRDLDAWPQWNRVCPSARWTSGQPWSLDATFRIRLRFIGLPLPFHVAVVEAAPPTLVAWSSTKFTITGRHTFRFDPQDGGTRVTDAMRFSSPLLPLRLFYPRPIIRAMSRGWLRSLKERLEVAKRS